MGHLILVKFFKVDLENLGELKITKISSFNFFGLNFELNDYEFGFKKMPDG